ncbi:hypothetical protein ACFL4O_02595 [bacterium]
MKINKKAGAIPVFYCEGNFMNTIFRKRIALILSAVSMFIFLVHNIWAGQEAYLLSSKIGRVVERYVSGSKDSKLGAKIYIVEDLHCNKECQLNIKNILEHINKTEGKINLIGVEGSTGEVELNIVKKLSKRDRKKLIKMLLQKGYINGEEIYGIENGVRIVGLEDKSIYDDNFKKLYQNVKLREQVLLKLNIASEKVKNMKDIIISACIKINRLDVVKNLKDVEKQKSLYEKGDLDLYEYLQFLKNRIKQDEYNKTFTNLVLFEQTEDLRSKIHFSGLESQYLILMKSIKHNLNDKDTAYIKNSSNKYTALAETAESKNIQYKKKYKAIDLYSQYVKLQKRIKLEYVIGELNKLEYRVRVKSVKGEDMENIIYIEDFLEKLKGYISNNASKEISEEVEAKAEDYNLTAQKMKEKIAEEIDVFKDKEIHSAFTAMKDFYKLAGKRDEIMVKNMLKHILKKTDPKIVVHGISRLQAVVMIVGGYHSRGITELLRSRGIGYTVIRPHAGKVDEKIYLDRVREQAQKYKFD